MTVTAVINERFRKLNSTSFRTKSSHQCRERRAIVDITIPNNETYATGGFPVDLSKVGGFTEVYLGEILIYPLLPAPGINIIYEIVPPSDNKASGAKISLILLSTGLEFSGNLAGPTVVSSEIIGI